MADEIRREELSEEEKELLRTYPHLFIGAEKYSDEIKRSADYSKLLSEFTKEITNNLKAVHESFVLLTKDLGISEEKLRGILRQNKELRQAFRDVVTDVEYLKRSVSEFEVAFSRIGKALVAPAKEFSMELDRSLGYFGGIKKAIGDVFESFREKAIEKMKDVGGMGAGIGVGFLQALPVVGAGIMMGLWATTLRERYAVMGRDVTSVLETVSGAMVRGGRVSRGLMESWLRAGEAFGAQLTAMAEAWMKTPEELRTYASEMTKAFDVSIDVASRSRDSMKGHSDVIKDLVVRATELGLVMSRELGISVGDVARKVNELGMAWGRTAQLSEIVDRWFGVLLTKKGMLALKTGEYADMVDKLKSQFGLLGLSIENSVKVADVLGRAFDRNREFLNEFGVIGMQKMIEGFAGFENKLKGNIGTLLFFSDALGEPIEGLEDLWNRLVKVGESYRSGGVFELGIRAYERMAKMIGEPGAKLWVAREMGLSPEQYAIFDKFINEFKDLAKGNERVRELLIKFVRGEGSENVVKELEKLGVDVKKASEFKEIAQHINREVTDPLKRIEMAVRDAIYQLTKVIVGIFQGIMGLLSAMVVGILAPFTELTKEQAKALAGYGIEQFAVGVRAVPELLKAFKDVGKEFGGLIGLEKLADIMEKSFDIPAGLRRLSMSKVEREEVRGIVEMHKGGALPGGVSVLGGVREAVDFDVLREGFVSGLPHKASVAGVSGGELILKISMPVSDVTKFMSKSSNVSNITSNK